MMLSKQKIPYGDGEPQLEAYIAYTEHNEKRPGVLIAHDWSGRSAFACEKADKMAELGYIGFALDMYGNAEVATSKEDKVTLMQPLIQNRVLLQKRMQAAFDTIKNLPQVNPDKIAVIGFCFGGLCGLDLARTGANLRAVVSVHGLLSAPENIPNPQIKAQILALHGFEDPMVSKDQLLNFAEEMTHAKAEWEIDIYGHTKHAFTNPQANDQALGTIYQPKSAERAWRRIEEFLREVL